jgi:tRNA modification GTPase
VGKSSLINALVGYRRAIVHETPGTTRDLVTARTALNGWPVEFCDTAGLRVAVHAIEQQGIGLAQRQLESASLVLLVFDAADPWCDEDAGLCSRFPKALPVFNKIDLTDAALAGRPAGQPVSAIDGRGIDDLIAAITDRLVPNPPLPGQAVPFLDDHTAALQAASEALAAGNFTLAADELAKLLS